MKPPECNSMQELRTILLRMGEMEGALAALKTQLITIPNRMAKELSTEKERLDAAHYLYWHTDIPISKIASLLKMKASGSASPRFLERIGTFTSDINCSQCGKTLVFQNRLDLREVMSNRRGRINHYVFRRDNGGRELVCEACYETAWKEQIRTRIDERQAK